MSPVAPTISRTTILTVAGVGALVYAFIPPGAPVWVGIAGTLLGAEPIARARESVEPLTEAKTENDP